MRRQSAPMPAIVRFQPCSGPDPASDACSSSAHADHAGMAHSAMTSESLTIATR